MPSTVAQQTALKVPTAARAGSPSRRPAYAAVLAFAPIQIDQQLNEMLRAPLRSRATATICGRYDTSRSPLKSPNSTATGSTSTKAAIMSVPSGGRCS